MKPINLHMLLKLTIIIGMIALSATVYLNLMANDNRYNDIRDISSIVAGVCTVICMGILLKNKDRYLRSN